MFESDMIKTVSNNDEVTSSKDTESNSSKTKRTRLTFPFGACRVCSDSATGIHYGIATCEGCKGFFKRSILRKEKYRCYFDNKCSINMTNRNRCKACRFRRCIGQGMSVDGVKMGRIPKLVKERALKELKEQQMKEEAALAEANRDHVRESSCSSLSDRSVENYDPNIMETDLIEERVSPIQRNRDLTNSHVFSFNSNDQKTFGNRTTILNDQDKKSSTLIYRTKFSPDDFTVDETLDVPLQSTGFLNNEEFQHVKTISNQFNINQLNFSISLNEDEETFLKFLRFSSFNTFHRRSKRVKQLISRMNEMIERNIQEFPGDNATLDEFFNSVRLSCQVYTRSTVVYIQEIPGMKNLNIESLKKMIFHRSFDWLLLKYHKLYNQNGQCYFLAPNGFQYTRNWLNKFNGIELTNAIFDFCHQFHQLDLNEREFSIVLSLHLFYSDPTMNDEQTFRMLKVCYLLALYKELCYNRSENQSKSMCRKILQVLELLIPITELYQKQVASQVFEAKCE